jgi:superkiller protein 3
MSNYSKSQAHNERYEELCQQGFDLIQSRSSKEALSYLEQALKIKSDDYKAFRYQGLALCKVGRFEKALSSYDKALEIKPDCYEVWSDRGYTLYVLGRCEEAFVSYYKALEVKPDYFEAQEKQELFLKEYQQAGKNIKYPLLPLELELDPCEARFQNDAQGELEQYDVEISNFYSKTERNSDWSKLRRLWFRRSDALLKLERYEDAASSYETSLGILQGKEIDLCAFRGVIPRALYNQGVALYNLQQLESAIAKFDEALNKGLDYPLPFYGRALSLEKLDHLEEAMSSLERALEISPCYSASWYIKGNLLKKLGCLQEANSCFGKALDISRTFGNQKIEKLAIEHLETPQNSSSSVAFSLKNSITTCLEQTEGSI